MGELDPDVEEMCAYLVAQTREWCTQNLAGDDTMAAMISEIRAEAIDRCEGLPSAEE